MFALLVDMALERAFTYHRNRAQEVKLPIYAQTLIFAVPQALQVRDPARL